MFSSVTPQVSAARLSQGHCGGHWVLLAGVGRVYPGCRVLYTRWCIPGYLQGGVYQEGYLASYRVTGVYIPPYMPP